MRSLPGIATPAIILFGTLLLFIGSCLEIPQEYSAVPPGIWRATLNLKSGAEAIDDAYDEHSEGILPFNFEVVYDSKDSFHIEIINGEERIVLDQIKFGRDRSISKDSVLITFPVYDSYIRALYEEDAIEGDWFVPNRGESYSIPFRARHGKDFRFSMVDPPVVDFSGRWEVTFKPDQPDAYPAIGVFEQERDGKVTGTFLTNTGDYRFLEGRTSGDRLYLSVFDGSHAYLFEAKMLEDGTISGIYRSGNHYKVYWAGRRNSEAVLENSGGFETPGVELTLHFALPNHEGDTISLTDEKYRGKPKIIQITGTWCPNCRDETEFIVDYFKKHPSTGIEVIALAFERHTDPELAQRAVAKYKSYYQMDYEVVYAGGNSKDLASGILGSEDLVKAFPTLFFLDNDNNVVAIHTGFNGPATDKYETFTREFDELVGALQNQ